MKALKSLSPEKKHEKFYKDHPSNIINEEFIQKYFSTNDQIVKNNKKWARGTSTHHLILAEEDEE